MPPWPPDKNIPDKDHIVSKNVNDGQEKAVGKDQENHMCGHQ